MSDIGQVLKEGRLALGLDIEDIAQKTRICGRYLRAMEDDKFEMIPKVFDKGYLKIYADFLRVDAKMLLALYEQQRKSGGTIPQH
jgi:cytoskeletal protein RodZ